MVDGARHLTSILLVLVKRLVLYGTAGNGPKSFMIATGQAWVVVEYGRILHVFLTGDLK